MPTLNCLKQALKQNVGDTHAPPTQPLTNAQYSDGFDNFVQGAGWSTYQNFIIPQLSQLLTPLLNSRSHLSVLEIGPGPKSVLGYLPHHQTQKVRRYAAFEPNDLFATRLESWLKCCPQTSSPLPSLESTPSIRRVPFLLDSSARTSTVLDEQEERFDVILFCHSMYGMSPKRKYIEKALEMLVPLPARGLVVVFHRDGTLDLDSLVCHSTVSFPDGFLCVQDEDELLDGFASFVAGFSTQDQAVRSGWRRVCRDLGRHDDKTHPGKLIFSAPEVMKAFTQHAVELPELISQVPSVKKGGKTIKNREARLHQPAAIVRPTEIRHVQECVRWAIKHNVALTIIGGGHGGQCVWPDVVAVDMDAFNQVNITMVEDENGERSGNLEHRRPLVVAGAGCRTVDIIHKAMESGLTVPLGSRPSVGSGLWLLGGIGHLARQHGLTCDAIVGAVLVSVDATGDVLCVGHVPRQHQPAGAVRPENEADLLWAIKGAGTNFGIVLSVALRAYPAPNYLVRNWIVPLSKSLDGARMLSDFDMAAKKLPRNCSVDAYVYWDIDQLHLGVTMYEAFTNTVTASPAPITMCIVLGPENTSRTVDGIGLFDTEMYMSGMHGGHSGGKTSSFKRCIFLKNIGSPNIANILVAAVEARPSPNCYLHLLHGGEAVRDVVPSDTAFGCRDWEFACVVTGVWPRDQDGTETAQAVARWVYGVIGDLSPLSVGIYGADLGPDPRDAPLATRAFGPNNRPRLARLKRTFDPQNVLAYACPLLRKEVPEGGPKLIVLVTGEHGVGKDYCADLWARVFHRQQGLQARVASISDATKREYAAAAGADVNRLIWDRAYKEQHRPALMAYFQHQLQKRPRLPEEHFLDAVYGAADVDVLLITGMREEAPVATFSHLVPGSRLVEVRVQASRETREIRRGCPSGGQHNHSSSPTTTTTTTTTAALNHNRPSFVFDNDAEGDEARTELFAGRNLLPYFHEGLQRLEGMVRAIPDFPRPGVEFRHVLGIAQRVGGLALCTDLLQSHFDHHGGDWAQVNAIAACEAGGFVFASALAARVGAPLALIREESKLPPPTVSVAKSSPSYISLVGSDSGGDSCGEERERERSRKRISMDRDAIPRGASSSPVVVVVDDVLASGSTLCAMLQLLTGKAGLIQANIKVLVVAEFPIHGARELLRQRGFGGVGVQSLLVFGGN